MEDGFVLEYETFEGFACHKNRMFFKENEKAELIENYFTYKHNSVKVYKITGLEQLNMDEILDF